VYDCVDGDWREVEACTGGDGGSGGAGSTNQSSSSTGGCTPPMFDHTGEMLNCTPDLQSPDCPIEAAEECNSCLTGCIDFFMCTADGWTDLAYCTEDGELVIVK
jgi:hypothetical protein